MPSIPSNQLSAVESEAPIADAPSSKTKRRRVFSAAYKSKIVEQASRCSAPGEITALLRREKLYSSHLAKWRSDLAKLGEQGVAEKRRGRPSTRDERDDKIDELERKLRKANRANEQLVKVVELQKKLCELLGLDPISEGS